MGRGGHATVMHASDGSKATAASHPIVHAARCRASEAHGGHTHADARAHTQAPLGCSRASLRCSSPMRSARSATPARRRPPAPSRSCARHGSSASAYAAAHAPTVNRHTRHGAQCRGAGRSDSTGRCCCAQVVEQQRLGKYEAAQQADVAQLLLAERRARRAHARAQSIARIRPGRGRQRRRRPARPDRTEGALRWATAKAHRPESPPRR